MGAAVATRVRPAVPRIWTQATAVCLGCGPSLTQADVDYCRGKAKVIAVNTSYELAPWADVLYACDGKWWFWHRGVPTFQGLKFALERGAGQWKGVQVLENTGIEGLETAPTGLKNGRNSGYQALGLAVHLGATRILLLGYDMHGSHWFGQHPDGRQSPYQDFLKRFPTLLAPLARLGVTVINCTPKSRLTCFPQMPLREAL